MSKILLNVCTSGHVNLDLVMLLLYQRSASKHEVTINISKRYPISANMNSCVDIFLNDKSYDWIVFIEQDIVPKMDFLNIIDDLPDFINVVSGWYRIARTKEEVIDASDNYDKFDLIIKYVPDEDKWRPMSNEEISNNTIGNYIACNNSGNGFIFIKRAVIETIHDKFGCCFSENFNAYGNITRSQDADFGYKLWDMGQKVWIDKRYRCYHIKEVYL